MNFSLIDDIGMMGHIRIMRIDFNSTHFEWKLYLSTSWNRLIDGYFFSIHSTGIRYVFFSLSLFKFILHMWVKYSTKQHTLNISIFCYIFSLFLSSAIHFFLFFRLPILMLFIFTNSFQFSF